MFQDYAAIARVEKQLTRTMVILTTVYIVFNLPSYILRFIDSTAGDVDVDDVIGSEETAANRRIADVVAYFLYYLHHSLNFYLYIFFSPQMRKALKDFAHRVWLNCCLCECIGGRVAWDSESVCV